MNDRSAKHFTKVKAELMATLLLAAFAAYPVAKGYADQPSPPCHPNPTAAADEAALRARGDIASLPGPLQDRLAQLANRPHTNVPMQAFAEANGASQLFQYYLLDTSGFQPNVFLRRSFPVLTTTCN